MIHDICLPWFVVEAKFPIAMSSFLHPVPSLKTRKKWPSTRVMREDGWRSLGADVFAQDTATPLFASMSVLLGPRDLVFPCVR